MIALIKNDKLPFKALKQMLKLSSGNLSTHLKKLKEADYVIIEKSFVDNKPKTEISISEFGKEAFRKYTKTLMEFFEGSLDI